MNDHPADVRQRVSSVLWASGSDNWVAFQRDAHLSLQMHWNTGTTNIVMLCINIPPNAGIAIGIIMSEPLPVEVKTGKSAIKVVAVVIAAGRIRFKPATTTAF